METLWFWDGRVWRIVGDLEAAEIERLRKMPGELIMAARIEGDGHLDPKIPVVTGESSRETVNKMHLRFRGLLQ